MQQIDKSHKSVPIPVNLLWIRFLQIVHFFSEFVQLVTSLDNATMASVSAFKIEVPDSKLSKLKTRLEVTDFPDELDEAGWNYGAPLSDVKRLTAYWKNEFDWRKQEEEMNKLPNFQTAVEVDGFDPLKIHFIHQKSHNANAIPLLFVHGCEQCVEYKHMFSSDS